MIAIVDIGLSGKDDLHFNFRTSEVKVLCFLMGNRSVSPGQCTVDSISWASRNVCVVLIIYRTVD